MHDSRIATWDKTADALSYNIYSRGLEELGLMATSSACRVSTVPPLPFLFIISSALPCVYSTAHKSSETQNTTGRVILIAYATLQAICLFFVLFKCFSSGTRESDRLEPPPPLDIKRQNNEQQQQETLECRMTPPSGCCSFQTHGCILDSLCVRACVRSRVV